MRRRALLLLGSWRRWSGQRWRAESRRGLAAAGEEWREEGLGAGGDLVGEGLADGDEGPARGGAPLAGASGWCGSRTGRGTVRRGGRWGERQGGERATEK